MPVGVGGPEAGLLSGGQELPWGKKWPCVWSLALASGTLKGLLIQSENCGKSKGGALVGPSMDIHTKAGNHQPHHCHPGSNTREEVVPFNVRRQTPHFSWGLVMLSVPHLQLTSGRSYKQKAQQQAKLTASLYLVPRE